MYVFVSKRARNSASVVSFFIAVLYFLMTLMITFDKYAIFYDIRCYISIW